MKKRRYAVISALLAVLLLAACAAAPAASASVAAVFTPASAPAAAQPAGEVDPALKEDFYEAVNTEWLAATEIPSDRPSAGGFEDLDLELEAVLMADFAAMLDGSVQPDSPELASFVEYYRQAMDFEAREAAGATPVLPYLEQIENLSSLQELSAQLAAWDLESMPLPFSAYVMADMKKADTNALYLSSAGLFLMDKSYYADEATKAAMQEAFAQMSNSLLILAGKSEAEATEITAQALAFDESLAPYTRSAEEASDIPSMYNPLGAEYIASETQNLDFNAYFEGLLGQVPETVIVTNLEFFDALDELVNDETFPAMKNWMLVQTVMGFANYLSEDFRVAGGSFSRMMTGIAEPTAKERAAYTLATSAFSEVVGNYYGETYFGEEAKKDVEAMVKSIIAAYEDRLTAADWLSESTRATAIKKLETMSLNLAYPDAIRPIFSKLQTVPTSEGGNLLANALAFTRVSKEDNYAQWNKPVDRGEWPLSANTVNAMYSPMNNSINFPAAILQAPFYSLEQPPAANYGGIGAIIAHEISHAFDPNGARFDELGNLANWWTEEDYAKFEEMSQAMVAQWDGLPFAGGTVNGTLTVTENVADAGGLACALQAAKQLPDADLQAFFTNWAVIWRMKATPEYESLLLTVDVHAPNKLRANIQLQNMDDFFTTFGVSEGDGMYRAPEDRVVIW